MAGRNGITFWLVFTTFGIYICPSLAREVTLYDSTRFSGLGWTTYPEPPGDETYTGWAEQGESYSRYYSVCQVRNPHASDGSWLRMPYIPRRLGNRISVEIEFTMNSCTGIDDAHQCKETFELFYYEASNSDPENQPPWTTPPYTRIKRIAAEIRFSETDGGDVGGPQTNLAVEEFATTANGFYLAFRDTGACMAIVRVRVYYVVCAAKTENFAMFPETVTGADLVSLVEVDGVCVTHAEQIGDLPIVARCQIFGMWTAFQGMCGCSPGFEADSQTCRACIVGTYKAGVGPDRCSPCPAKSHADHNSTRQCTCIPDFFRVPEEGPEVACTGPPSAPRDAQATVDNKSSVVTLTWQPPADNGGRTDLHYWVECPLCPPDTEYSPRQRDLPGLEVNVSRLASHTTYEFVVYAGNGVSQQSINGGAKPQGVVVNATTFSSVPSAVRAVTVDKEASSETSVALTWRPPMFPNGQILTYQVRYRTTVETVDQSKYHYQKAVAGEVQSTVIMGLEAGKDYVFAIAATTKDGVGEYSTPIQTTTGGGPKSQMYNTAIIAGAVAAFFIIMVLVAIVIFLLICWRRRKANQLYLKIASCPNNGKKEVPPIANGMIYSNGPNGEAVILPHVGKVRTYIDPFTYEDPVQAVREFATEIDASCIRILDVIGGGEFGDVCSGLMLMPDKSTRKVAVKTLKTGASDKDRADFLSEASIMGQFDDPNVIELLGVVTRTRPAMIVTEYMENRSLDTFLKENDGKFSVPQLISMMRGIASGMRYLSEMNFVHRDLAARNILVSSTLVCKVADFGLSRRKHEGAYETKGGKIPIRWTAPEAIAFKKFTSASDVWSYGVVMWEIMSYGERPYWNWPNQDVIRAVDKGYRLPPPMDCPEALHQLMLDCWQKDRNHRPTFSTIVSTLDRLTRNPHALRPLAKAEVNQINNSATDVSQLRSVTDWLESIKMGRYKDTFSQAGYVRLEDIARISQGDLPRLGVNLVGHQKKIMKSIQAIRSHLEQSEETLV
ncbi:ephrin type-B receptor 1-B-like isoform X2 [Acanthaster planci]|uniref:receptor protein-tyrosine kinase n=1 Tax=Acanthaster planci TaxID=133434 RepID=A0A8B7XX21_ACAPL|nr:ephrin type-B receptor 1-B-like isoform X2 [Acanthaster planci]